MHSDMMYALASPPVPGAQWTGIVTQIAVQMLESGQVEAVVCVQSDEHDRFTPKPVRHITLTMHFHTPCIKKPYCRLLSAWAESFSSCTCNCARTPLSNTSTN